MVGGGSVGGQKGVCSCRSWASLDTDNEMKSIRVNVYIRKGRGSRTGQRKKWKCSAGLQNLSQLSVDVAGSSSWQSCPREAAMGRPLNPHLTWSHCRVAIGCCGA